MLPSWDLDGDKFGSHGVQMVQAAHLTSGTRFRAHIARFEPGAVLGRHPATSWQLFTVIDGSGWIATDDRHPRPLDTGETVIWEPGEVHESGSETGMTALIVQSDSEALCVP